MRLALLPLALTALACSPAAPAPVTPPPATHPPLFASAAPASSAPAPAPASAWQSKLHADHPLVGKIWNTRDRAFVDEAALLARARAASHVMLGEKHDNVDHHRLQALVLAGLVGDRPAVVFEMIEIEQQPTLDGYLKHHPDPSGIGVAVEWEKRGWPAWSTYQPIAEVALGAGLPLVAGNLPAAEARAVVKQGLASLGDERLAAWGLKTPLEARLRSELEGEMRDSHCGHLPDKIIPGMADAQQARDAAMADSLLKYPEAVLISGFGHARTDRGVPRYLRARKPSTSVVSVAFVEVTKGQDAPPDLPYDLVWFTPRVDDSDPCEKMMKK